ncbi:MAG: DUF1127 domain-containing protein [Alkalilacustris sp.]
MSDTTTTRPLGALPSGFSLRLFDSLLAWNNRRVTRNELYRLSDRELEDIGLSRADIDTVVERLR